MKPLTPVAGYLRMSSGKQDVSIAQQRTEIEAYAAKHKYKIVAWYTDEAISGWKANRGDFQQLVADAANGTFQGVLCWDQARFSRFDPMEANHYWYLLRNAGVFLELVKEGRIDWNSLGGWLTASVNQHGKAEYCRSLAHDVTRGRRAAILAGRWITPPPYGYKLLNGKLAPDENAATVRRIFELRAKGWGRPAICSLLNKENIPSPRGKKWVATQLRMMLTKQTYAGDQVMGKWSRGKFCKMTDEVRVFPNTHPAIIDRALWERVQRMNESKANQSPGRSGRKLGGPLSGLLVCKKCGATMFFEKRHDRYICSTYHTHKGNGCTNNSIRC